MPDALLDELRRNGFAEGKNVTLLRYFYNRSIAKADLARDLDGLKPDVIVAFDGGQVRALTAALATVPIVASMADPVGRGYAASLARPGGQVTGVTGDTGERLYGKRLQLLKEAVPAASRIGFVTTRGSWDVLYRVLAPSLAEPLGLMIHGCPVEHPHAEAEYRRAFDAMAHERIDALMIGDPIENFINRRLIIALAEKARLPAMYPFPHATNLGGQFSYTPDFGELGRHMGSQIAQIFNGRHPGDIPFYRATRFTFSVNLRAAKALHIEVPAALIASADEVIE